MNLLNLLQKEIKRSASLAFYLFSSTCLINSTKHVIEHSCKILYVKMMIGFVKSYSNCSLFSLMLNVGNVVLCICWYTSVLNNLLNVIKSILLLGEIFVVFLYCHPLDYR